LAHWRDFLAFIASRHNLLNDDRSSFNPVNVGGTGIMAQMPPGRLSERLGGNSRNIPVFR
jgi:hypothetical protein